MVSKDLYILRRGAELYQVINDRLNPIPDNTDFVALLEAWAEGFYTELDFINEANNQIKFKKIIVEDQRLEGIYVPDVYMDYCRRRILVSEWIDGIKLTDAPKDEIAKNVALSQECFLRQLLEVGFFHNDPHPGNLLLMDDRTKGSICIVDFGLMVQVPEADRQTMVSAIIHLSNRNYEGLTMDFANLGFLPMDVDKNRVIPVLDKILTPYVTKGGGSKAFKSNSSEEFSFKVVTRDLLQARFDVPF